MNERFQVFVMQKRVRVQKFDSIHVLYQLFGMASTQDCQS